jgi:Arc/MetJ family transcription regulator
MLQGSDTVRTTVSIDDKLLERAKFYSGLEENTSIIRLALKKFVEGEAARRLALLGGSQPNLEVPPRRRSEPA